MNSKKHLFSLRPDIHYLNCAFKAPLLRSAEEAAIKALIRERNPVDISTDDFFQVTSEVRESFAQLVNCTPGNVVIIPSTSYGFSSVLNNIAAKQNGNVITIQDEFPSGYFSLRRWSEKNQNELVIVRPDRDLNLIGENWNQKILDAINENTSIVLISSVHWMNGLKFDLKSIGEKCRKVNAKFIVDGTQSVGALPMDVKEYKIDALICASYKWLLGPYSVGLAYISEQFNNGTPLEESWMNRTNAKNFSTLTEYETAYQADASRYNVGELSNFILMPMLNESLQQLIIWNPKEIQNYSKKLIKPLFDFLSGMGIETESENYFSNHLFALKLPPEINPNELKENLLKYNIFISNRGESIRTSVNVFNDEHDIAELISAIKSTYKK